MRHPLCVALVRRKWLGYGRYLYYLGLFFYFVYLAFLTTYALLTPNAQAFVNITFESKFCENIKNVSARAEIEELYKPGLPFYVSKFGILVIASFNLLLEIIQWFRVSFLVIIQYF